MAGLKTKDLLESQYPAAFFHKSTAKATFIRCEAFSVVLPENIVIDIHELLRSIFREK